MNEPVFRAAWAPDAAWPDARRHRDGRPAMRCMPRPVLADIPDQFDGTKFQLAAPDPNPKYGGVLRMGITNRVPHFDLHQSGTYQQSRRRWAACSTT